jgi:hypothetical protein
MFPMQEIAWFITTTGHLRTLVPFLKATNANSASGFYKRSLQSCGELASLD